MGSYSIILAASEIGYVWDKATIEGKIIILILAGFSIFAWSIMASKLFQMRQARRLNFFFNDEFNEDEETLAIYKRDVKVTGCPLYSVYSEACRELLHHIKGKDQNQPWVSLKAMEHIKRSMETVVAEQSLRLESGLILLAIAVSGAPFLGLLGTVWGVMSVFSHVAEAGVADLPTMAPGLSAAMMTTVAGLLVAIPSMFGYNGLVHNLRVLTVQLDNFAQQLASRIEKEYLRDDDDRR